MDDLPNLHDVFVFESAEVLDFAQGCQREALVRHLVHQHVQLLQGVQLDLACARVFILSPVHFAKSALAYLLDLLEVAQTQAQVLLECLVLVIRLGVQLALRKALIMQAMIDSLD